MMRSSNTAPLIDDLMMGFSPVSLGSSEPAQLTLEEKMSADPSDPPV